MTTFSDVLTRHNVEIPEHLVADAEVPVISDRPQAQGDLLIIPMRPGQIAGLAPVPAEGIAVVRGENGGNTHWLSGDGPVAYKLDLTSSPDVASVEVGEGGTAFLIHTDEHGANAMGPGQYTIRRQREQAEEIRLVQD
jgi:hypothetical protein